MNKIGVQVQQIGARLCWQVYIENPGNPLGLGEMVHVVSSSTASSLQPPTPLAPIEKEGVVQFPLMPKTDDTNSQGANNPNWDYTPWGGFGTAKYYIPPGDDPTVLASLAGTVDAFGHSDSNGDWLSTNLVDTGNQNFVVFSVMAKYYYAATPRHRAIHLRT